MAEKKKSCWLHGYGGPCRGKRNGEHYISRALLEILAAGKTTAVLGGLPFQAPNTLEELGINSLTTRIYCEGHNSGLSPLDTALAGVFRFVHLVNIEPDGAHPPRRFKGALLERALLKVVVGVSAVERRKHLVPEQWKALLVGKGAWPQGHGLYLGRPADVQIHDGTFYYDAMLHPNTGTVAVASFFLAGITLNLVLADIGDRDKFGIYRGRGYIFKHPDRDFRLELEWPHEPNECVVLTRIGTTEEPAPHARGWKTMGIPR
ncbi:MAG: hypothetical protein ACOY0T_31165 [Myxococcota bacterium]